MYFLGVKAASA